MVTEMPYDGPKDIAYEVFDQAAQKSDDLYAEANRHNAELHEKTRESGLIRSSSSEAKLVSHPRAGSFEIEEPAYCISVWDEDYRTEGRKAAERIEEEFGINVYLFERE